MEVKKIILLLFPPIINKFNFTKTEKEAFFDMGELKKNLLKEQSAVGLSYEEACKLTEFDYSFQIKNFIQNNFNSRLILVNYPNSQQQFDSLTNELAQEGKKIDNIVLLSISNYELILDIQKDYLICPLCETIHKKEEMIKAGDKISCPCSNQYQFSLEDVKKFSDFIIGHHLKSTELIIKKFLADNRGSVASIIRLDINKKEEVFNGEVQQNLLRVIESL
ncbi:MAG: Adenylate kinase [Mycoplasmataceae bacterium]|nr:MAG: Adenylate kinase [Mycoplasmataceae bacterium]